MHDTAATSPQTVQQWTVLSLINWSTQHLAGLGFDEARLHVELLLAEVLGYSRLQLYTNFDRPLTPAELSSFKGLYRRRLAHEPLQYILGYTDFMGLRLAVSPAALIPRPETEQLVEMAMEWVSLSGKSRVGILDVGTGTGNIAIALAKRCPEADITSIDVSRDALELAQRNAALNETRGVNFFLASVFDDFLPGQRFDLLVSNPPYISLDEFAGLQPEVRDFEPRLATTDEADGYKFIRRIAEVAARRVSSGGGVFVEIAYNQKEEAMAIFSSEGLVAVSVQEDYSGHPRILSARVP